MRDGAQISFGPIDRLALFGGSWLTGALLERTPRLGLNTALFSSERHLAEPVAAEGTTLRELADAAHVPAYATEDINRDPRLAQFITDRTLGLALGAAWVFSPDTVRRLGGRLLDFMGIALPRYRGGAHYSWQILSGTRQGSCNLQIVYGGDDTFHRGEILKRRDYLFPASARIPQDYFEAAVPVELAFLEEFFAELRAGQTFTPQPLQETFATTFPFLNTSRHGYVDWQWAASEIERFICAFDRPYAGASTFLDGRRVFLRDCHAEREEGSYHPFQAGLIYRVTPYAAFIAARGGSIAVRSLTSAEGADLLPSIRAGARLHTPSRVLEEALSVEATYGPAGLTIGGGAE